MKERKRQRDSRRPEWEEFEVAVAEFAKSLDPTDVVTHSARRPDIDTGRLRQRDVWIEAKVCGMFPVKILVSCKRKRRPLNEQDIDAFIGELRSSGAHKGVLYSFAGFTAGALEKAERLGICCCRLLRRTAASLPPSVIFQVFHCRPEITVGFSRPLDPRWGLTSFEDLLALKMPGPDGEESVLDFMARIFVERFKTSSHQRGPAVALPPDWQQGIGIRDNDGEREDITLVLKGTWAIYTTRAEAVLFDGTYSVSGGGFVGPPSGPLPGKADPRPSWTRLESPADTDGLMGITLSQGLGDIREILRESFGSKGLPVRTAGVE